MNGDHGGAHSGTCSNKALVNFVQKIYWMGNFPVKGEKTSR